MALSPQFLLPCKTPSHPRIQGCSLERTPRSHLLSSHPLWGGLGAPWAPQLHPCPAWPLYGLGASPALGHSPHPCRLSAHLRHQHCSLACFHFGPRPSGFRLLAPSSPEILQESAGGHTSASRASLSQTCQSHPALCPSAPPFVTLLHVFSRRRRAPGGQRFSAFCMR